MTKNESRRFNQLRLVKKSGAEHHVVGTSKNFKVPVTMAILEKKTQDGEDVYHLRFITESSSGDRSAARKLVGKCMPKKAHKSMTTEIEVG